MAVGTGMVWEFNTSVVAGKGASASVAGGKGFLGKGGILTSVVRGRGTVSSPLTVGEERGEGGLATAVVTITSRADTSIGEMEGGAGCNGKELL